MHYNDFILKNKFKNTKQITKVIAQDNPKYGLGHNLNKINLKLDEIMTKHVTNTYR